MKLKHLAFFLGFVLPALLVFQSCSVEKRHYSGGYYFSLKSDKKHSFSSKAEASAKKEKKSDNEVTLPLDPAFNNLTASSEKSTPIIILSPDTITCDTMVLKDSTEIKAIVTEVTPTEVKYKYCNNPEGPVYVVYRYKISFIRYKNGMVDSFAKEFPPENNKQNSYAGTYNQNVSPAANSENYSLNEYVRRISTNSLICGIVSFVIPFVGIFTSINAIILANRSLRIINNDPSNFWMYRNNAKAGLILGWIFVSLIIALILLLVIFASLI